MPATDRSRRQLYDSLARSLGPEPADTLMELLPPVGWSDVARRGDLAELRGEIAELRGELAVLRGSMLDRFGRVERQIATLVAANVVTLVGVVTANALL